MKQLRSLTAKTNEATFWYVPVREQTVRNGPIVVAGRGKIQEKEIFYD